MKSKPLLKIETFKDNLKQEWSTEKSGEHSLYN